MTLGKPWVKGQSGNPAGRPAGSRNRLGEAFISAMANDFAAHGAATIERVRSDFPAVYLRLAAAFAVKGDDAGEPISPEHMTDEELTNVVAGKFGPMFRALAAAKT